MALKVELKPGERVIVGESVITNGPQRTSLTIEGRAPILREKDILRVEDADTPCKKIYLTVQMMYLGSDPAQMHEVYFGLVRDVKDAAPSTTPFLQQISNHILSGALYKALKEAKNLIRYEAELMDHAKSR